MNYGYSAKETIDHLRKTRSSLVLCNKDYVEWLLAKDLEVSKESEEPNA